MNWFYAVNDRKNGPVSDSQLEDLLRSGTINQDTLIWCEGMADWQPMRQVRGNGTPPPVIDDPSRTCVECGRSYPPSELIQIHQSSVCAACKPIFLQRLSEGAALPSSAVNFWRSGNLVVTVNKMVFPDRCIKCNQPAHGYRLKRTLYWRPPVYYLLLLLCICMRFFGLLILIILALVGKKATVEIALCPEHQAARKKLITTAWIIIGIGVLLMLSVIVMQNEIPAVIGIFVFLFGGFFGAIASRCVTAAKITKENVWIKGAKEQFLSTLPDWPGI